MIRDEDQVSVYEKAEEKMEDASKPLVSFESSDEEEIETILAQSNWNIKFRKKIISDLTNFYKCSVG